MRHQLANSQNNFFFVNESGRKCDYVFDVKLLRRNEGNEQTESGPKSKCVTDGTFQTFSGNLSSSRHRCMSNFSDTWTFGIDLLEGIWRQFGDRQSDWIRFIVYVRHSLFVVSALWQWYDSLWLVSTTLPISNCVKLQTMLQNEFARFFHLIRFVHQMKPYNCLHCCSRHLRIPYLLRPCTKSIRKIYFWVSARPPAPTSQHLHFWLFRHILESDDVSTFVCNRSDAHAGDFYFEIELNGQTSRNRTLDVWFVSFPTPERCCVCSSLLDLSSVTFLVFLLWTFIRIYLTWLLKSAFIDLNKINERNKQDKSNWITLYISEKNEDEIVIEDEERWRA